MIQIAIAVAIVSLTVTRSRLFKGFRGWFRPHPLLHELVRCPYCFSHWVAGALMAVHMEIFDLTLWEWFIDSLVVVAIAAPIMAIVHFCITTISQNESGSAATGEPPNVIADRPENQGGPAEAA